MLNVHINRTWKGNRSVAEISWKHRAVALEVIVSDCSVSSVLSPTGWSRGLGGLEGQSCWKLTDSRQPEGALGEEPAGSELELVGNEDPESLRILLWCGAVHWWEGRSEFFKLWELKTGFIFALSAQLHCYCSCLWKPRALSSYFIQKTDKNHDEELGKMGFTLLWTYLALSVIS